MKLSARNVLKGTIKAIDIGAVEEVLRKSLVPLDLLIPYAEGALRSKIFSCGSVQWFREGEEGTRMHAFIPPALQKTVRPYSVQQPEILGQ